MEYVNVEYASIECVNIVVLRYSTKLGRCNMETIILDNINEVVSNEEIFQKLKIDAEHEYASEALEFAEKAKKVARPKALYGTAYIEHKDENHVIIEGIRFTSRLLSKNLNEVYKVFPYVATCGHEVYDWAKSLLDPIERYWAEALCEIYLNKAYVAMKRDFEHRVKPGKTAAMNPGSLENWPISEQKQLFTLLGEENTGAIGVQLTESFLMLPIKSISGIIFQTEFDYENCMLCPRERCPGRRAKYDPDAAKMIW